MKPLQSGGIEDIADDLSSTGGSEDLTEVEERDELRELEKLSKKETDRVLAGRLGVTLALLVTAIAVTITTYIFLREEQNRIYLTAYDQFARTISDSAIQTQRNIREASATFADSLSSMAEAEGATWPFFYPHDFESFGRHARIQSGLENFAVMKFVNHEDREKYETYAGDRVTSFVEEGHMFLYGNTDRMNVERYSHNFMSASPAGFIPSPEGDWYSTVWAYTPPPMSLGVFNFDARSVPDYHNALNALQALKNEIVITRVRPYALSVGTAFTQEEHEALHSKLPDSSTEHPHSFVYIPIYAKANNPESGIVGAMGAGLAWDVALRNLLPEGVEGIQAVFKNTCNQTYTYQINESDAIFIGDGDLHDHSYDDQKRTVELSLDASVNPAFATTPGHCIYFMEIYPSDDFKELYISNTPEIFAIVVATAFALTYGIFYFFDSMVRSRNKKLLNNAARSNAIVTSLFPGTMRDRVLQADNGKSTKNLKSFVDEKPGDNVELATPLAELYIDCTTLMADIAGFTAWSSTREPSQVFVLLETIYSAFDSIAKRRRVCKVETVGDCYVAVAGCPEPRKDHAVAMVRFARDCMIRMSSEVHKLEVTLGPDTTKLTLRIGIHSGPVTAGVLRGERSRFQLFGDTMNTTARIESSCEKGRIQLSSDTAELLRKSGKGDWVEPRDDMISAKGKGRIKTWWLKMASSASGSKNGGDSSHPMDGIEFAVDTGLDGQTKRLVDWNVELLLKFLKQVIARRNAAGFGQVEPPKDDSFLVKGEVVLDEVAEIISLPAFDAKVARRQQDPETVEVPSEVVDQLRDYISLISSLYRQNSFHNFEHACHVVSSVCKLMSRIVAPKQILDPSSTTMISGSDEDSANNKTDSIGRTSLDRVSKKKMALDLHDHTYGITSDPLTQFACAFSALIHDVDHTGVPNPQLIKEHPVLGKRYKERSVAEQNSLDLAWNLLMDDNYRALRGALCATQEELRRFRALVVNSVLATDIADKDLKALRNARWDKAFHNQSLTLSTKSTHDEDLSSPGNHIVLKDYNAVRDDVNRKATIVIEHIIQASDIAHTMQHWHVYRKWNENLFRELYQAYKDGRAAKHPADFWYEGEKGFFDFYILPLAKKLKECGVFGISSDEYLNYALRNREEWEVRGQEVVAEMVANLADLDGKTDTSSTTSSSKGESSEGTAGKAVQA